MTNMRGQGRVYQPKVRGRKTSIWWLDYSQHGQHGFMRALRSCAALITVAVSTPSPLSSVAAQGTERAARLAIAGELFFPEDRDNRDIRVLALSFEAEKYLIGGLWLRGAVGVHHVDLEVAVSGRGESNLGPIGRPRGIRVDRCI